MAFKQSKHSELIRFISCTIDIIILVATAFLLPLELERHALFFLYITLSWGVLSTKNRFYNVQRYSKLTRILVLTFRQFMVFFLVLYAYIGFFKDTGASRLNILDYFLVVLALVFVFKLFIYFVLLRYSAIMGTSLKKVMVLGDNKKTTQLIRILRQRKDFGYSFTKQFAPEKPTFSIAECQQYALDNDIAEIYCSVAELRNTEIKEMVNFADNNLILLKFLPDNKNIFTKKLKLEYYDYVPLLSLRENPLGDPIHKLVKRVFDFVFSSLVIVFLLSWLVPIIGILIKLESKGPVFFKQKRSGINNKEFECYKFRSMRPNKDADKHQATKGDMRVTKIGRFIRKTSIDELPQFFNVFLGEMSVVGPRPHMLSHTKMYAERIDKFMVRHFVKPGITGLAQVKGCRGEIETERDILNRVKYDIFYTENWSMFLDIKIIVQTVYNAIKGEEKAY